MTATLLPTVEVEPSAKATASVIFLHGLGADGHDFESVVPHLVTDTDAAIRFVFPHAPKRPVSLNQGFVMPAWFDIGPSDLTRGESSDLPGVKKAADQIRALVDREVARGIPSRNIVVGGFSQGGALATYVALRHPQPLAGLVALSTFIPKNAPLESETTSANRSIPAFVASSPITSTLRTSTSHAAGETYSLKIWLTITWSEATPALIPPASPG